MQPDNGDELPPGRSILDRHATYTAAGIASAAK
jgi:hypothetical protein